ncbi:MAG TPA: hypothetical protein VK463_14640 [Desulfomonilaceae bacterium]|nr:hypothetical protein [Desulfomonilaceae bacterium]
MRLVTCIGVCAGLLFGAESAGSADFGLAENALGELRGTRYENVYTKVPTSGKLISIKITDSGKIYYICREKTGYAIYHLEVRPIAGFKEKIEQELKDTGRQWDRMHPDELLFTKERYDHELKKRLLKYSEAVWVRNEIIVEEPPKPRAKGE